MYIVNHKAKPSGHTLTAPQKQLLLEHSRTRMLTMGDGNCMFHSIGNMLGVDHLEVRATAISKLQSGADVYKDFVSCSWELYLSKMSVPGEWGDHTCLKALADAYSRQLILFADHLTNPKLTIEPQESLHPPLFILFWAEKHYEATIWIEPSPDPSLSGGNPHALPLAHTSLPEHMMKPMTDTSDGASAEVSVKFPGQ